MKCLGIIGLNPAKQVSQKVTFCRVKFLSRMQSGNLNKSVESNRQSPVNYLDAPKVLVVGISSVNSSSFDSIKFFFRLKLSSAENPFYKTGLFSLKTVE